MKLIIGIILIVAGIALGLYFGLWWALIGGIVAIIKQLQAPHANALIIAIGIVRIIFAGAIGWLTFLVCGFVGVMFISSQK